MTVLTFINKDPIQFHYIKRKVCNQIHYRESGTKVVKCSGKACLLETAEHLVDIIVVKDGI